MRSLSSRAIRIPLVVALVLVSGGPGRAAMSRGQADADAPAPKDMTSAYAQAEAAAEAEDYSGALRLVRHALSLDPTDADAYNLLGYCLRKTGDLPGAFDAYEKALKLRPRFPQAREYLAEAHVDAALEEARRIARYGDEGRPDLVRLVRALRRATAEVGTLAGEDTGREADRW